MEIRDLTPKLPPDRAEDLPDELIQVPIGVYPTHDDQQIVLPGQIGDIDPVALEGEGRTRRRRKRQWAECPIRCLRWIVQEPVAEPIGVVRRPGGLRYPDPLSRDQLPAVPFAV